ncbi:similar to tetraspanin TE736 [Schistosoma mansoni]|uniref:similar to tetraspanin TE736 n=1 Tax=Schistosoma mansoni TaxID=6183 RepID=UPI00022C86E1|nr:similar to tetraspanin TE736 [Schistosoma mansoni]|eukprot:XP_018645504.1 similar to tetraspanin TE736 [Schistosoma mansoni]
MMILSYLEKYWKSIIILSNLIFIVSGIVFLSLGINELNYISKFLIILHNTKPIIIPIMITTGTIGSIASLIGFIGLFQKKQFIILLHIGGLIIAALIEFSTGIISAISKDQFFVKVNSSLQESITQYHQNYEIKNEYNNLQISGCVRAITEYIQQYIITLMYLCFIFAILKGIYIMITILLYRKTDIKGGNSYV